MEINAINAIGNDPSMIRGTSPCKRFSNRGSHVLPRYSWIVEQQGTRQGNAREFLERQKIEI